MFTRKVTDFMQVLVISLIILSFSDRPGVCENRKADVTPSEAYLVNHKDIRPSANITENKNQSAAKQHEYIESMADVIKELAENYPDLAYIFEGKKFEGEKIYVKRDKDNKIIAVGSETKNKTRNTEIAWVTICNTDGSCNVGKLEAYFNSINR